MRDRDRWLDWSAPHRVARLKLILQNRRFLVRADQPAGPNLTSPTRAAARRARPEHWQQRFGPRPLLAERFTDPAA